MTTTYRADHIGSLLRPLEVLDAHAAQARGEISLDRLRALNPGLFDAAHHNGNMIHPGEVVKL